MFRNAPIDADANLRSFWIILPRIVFLAGNGEIFENHRSGDHRIVGGRRPPVCCTHTLSRRSQAAQIDMPSTPSPRRYGVLG